jgi:hypothetical protein
VAPGLTHRALQDTRGGARPVAGTSPVAARAPSSSDVEAQCSPRS